jgi:hypothetical protein
MDLLSHEYASSSDEEQTQPQPIKRTRINAAPDVNVDVSEKKQPLI